MIAATEIQADEDYQDFLLDLAGITRDAFRVFVEARELSTGNIHVLTRENGAQFINIVAKSGTPVGLLNTWTDERDPVFQHYIFKRQKDGFYV